MSNPTDTSKTYIWLITGASRGLGLEMTTQLLSPTSPTINIVIATCRSPTSHLHILQLDTASEPSIRAVIPKVASILGEQGGLDYLVNNAGMNDGDDSPFSFSASVLSQTLQTNLIGPALLTQLLYPFITRSARKVIVNLTSGLASAGLDISPKCTTYSVSKAGLNMLTYKQARTDPSLIAFLMDPGWVKTKMGGPGAVLEAFFSVSHILAFVTTATSAHSGRFFRYTGEEVPW